MNNLGAWHNSKKEKEWMISEAIDHANADRFVGGTYGDNVDGVENFRACSVGCSIYSINKKNGTSINTSSHSDLAKFLGLDDQIWLMRLQDSIFEELTGEDQINWTERLYRAIPVGADISLVLPRFLSYLLNQCLSSVEAPEFKQQKEAIEGVIGVVEDWVKKGTPDIDAACSARAAADAAAYSARSAGAAGAAGAATDVWLRFGNKLIQLLEQSDKH